MLALLQQLVGTGAYLVACSFVIGVVFDRLSPGGWRDAAIGFVGGVGAFWLMAMPTSTSGLMIDGRTPMLIVTGFFGGPIGALVATPLPLSLRIESGGPSVYAGIAVIITAVGLGAFLRWTFTRTGRQINRSSAFVVAGASPLVFIAFVLVPGFLADPIAFAPVLVPLLLWTPAGSLIFALVVLNELARSDTRRDGDRRKAFLSMADHVGADFFERQLHQLWQIHHRYGAHFAYMVVSVDNGLALARHTPREIWEDTFLEVGKRVRGSVRDCDICAPVAADRFAVLLPYTASGAVLQVAKRMQTDVSTFVELSGEPITVSIGIAHVDDSNSPNDLVVLAETALVMANAVTPRNAIGPLTTEEDTADPIVRSFPGALPKRLSKGTLSPPASTSSEEQNDDGAGELRRVSGRARSA